MIVFFKASWRTFVIFAPGPVDHRNVCSVTEIFLKGTCPMAYVVEEIIEILAIHTDKVHFVYGNGNGGQLVTFLLVQSHIADSNRHNKLH